MKTEPFTLATSTPNCAPAPTVAQLLDFEASAPAHSGHKEEAIRRELKLKPARYYLLLHRAATSPEGLAHDPITCRLVAGRRSDHDRRMHR